MGPTSCAAPTPPAGDSSQGPAGQIFQRVGAKWKGRAAKGQAGEGAGDTQRTRASVIRTSLVPGGPPVATVGMSHHPQAHLLLLGGCQKASL